MTLKARRFRLALLVATMVAMLGALVLAGSSGPLTGLLGGAVAWAAPNAQVSPPAVSFKNSELAAQEGETVSLELNLSSPVSSALVVGYSVAWPEGRPGTGSGTVQFAANTTAATATITVPSDDVVGPRAREDFMISLDQPGSASGYTLGTNQAASVTILEGVCDRSERVQYLILEAVATATECHQVTDSDLSGAPKLTGPLHWGQGKLIPTDESAEVRESKRPWLKAGDFRGMSGATELYLGFNQLKRLPPGVFDGLSNLKILYASHNLIETLEPGVFTGLNSLTELGLGKNLQEKFELSPKLKPLDRNSFTVEIPEGAPLPVSVTLSAEGGILSAGSVTIPAGTTTSPQVTLTPQQEGSAAGVKITDANFTTKEHYYIGVSSDHTLNVPVPTISVANPEVEVTEGSTAQVRLTVSPSPQLPITVNYELGNDGDPDTVDADSFDYDSAGSVTLQSGATGAIVAVDINQDDDIDEGAREFLALRLQEGDDPRQYVRGSVNSATIIIKEGICDRTIAVQSAILTALEKASGECAEVTDDELAQYSGALDISGDVGVASLNSRDFTGLSSLTELNLANATMGTLPRGVFDDLDSLTTLYLHDGSLASLDQNTFAGLTSLTFLRLDNNELAALPAALFSGLTSLDTLYLDNNELAALPSALFSGLTSLESLRLDNNELAALPAALFSGLSKMETLQLDNNELAALPVALFSGLTKMKTLQLDNNELTALPAALFSGLTNLQTLQLDNNELAALPVALFSGLTSLDTLQLDNNELTALPAALFSGLTNLQTLQLDNNQLAALPAALFSGLTNLQTLQLDNNQLAALPAALFSGLTNLQTLYLDNNELTALPAALFSGLANLVTLDVRTNKLEALPAGIFLGLDSLSEIYFSDNATENGEPIELTAGLVKSLSLNDDGEFIVTVATPYGWPGSLQANLSGANATPARKEVPLASGNSDSGDITYKWVDVSKDATVCLEPSNGAAIRPGFTTLIGLTFVAAPACFTIQPIQPPPPPPTGPTVTITDARVTQVEGKKAQISFVLSSKATKGFDLRYTTVIDGNDETVDAKEGKDYTTRPARVKVGEDRGTISIPIVDDTEIDEGILEYFVVKLIGPENGKDYRIGSQGITSTVVINDGICDRADIVKKAILGKLPGVSLCHAVTESHLRGIQGTMGLAKKEDPVTLQAGEFRELSALGHLNLSGVNLSQVLLPGLFEGLDSVIALNLCDTNISSLNAGDFSGLGKIAHLSADKNKIKSLPADLFKNVPTLKVVKLYSNEIATLDANVFRHAHSLTMVELQDNELSDLPDGLFKGLTKLTHVQLQENPKSPFKLTPTLREQDTSSFVVEIKEGAPFDISVPFTVIGGTAPVSSVTIPAGKTQAEDEVTVKRTEGNTGTVKVRMSTPIWVGGSTVAAGAKGLLLTAGGPLDLPVPNSESP